MQLLFSYHGLKTNLISLSSSLHTTHIILIRSMVMSYTLTGWDEFVLKVTFQEPCSYLNSNICRAWLSLVCWCSTQLWWVKSRKSDVLVHYYNNILTVHRFLGCQIVAILYLWFLKNITVLVRCIINSETKKWSGADILRDKTVLHDN